MKTDLFQSCGHCWVFQICWHIECSTFTASSFRIGNSSTGFSSPPLDFFVVMLSKAHLTSHSRMSGTRSVITPPWLSGLFWVLLIFFFVLLFYFPLISDMILISSFLCLHWISFALVFLICKMAANVFDLMGFYFLIWLPGGSVDKESVCDAGDLGLIPGLGSSPGEEKGYPVQYTGLENSMVHGITKSWTELNDFRLLT